MRHDEMFAAHTRAAHARLAFSILLALSFCFALALDSASAADKKPAYGRIQVSTSPGGFPLLIDGKPAGDTTPQARLLDLPPGPHTVEILFPNNRWIREFNIVAGRVNCIALNYRARAVVAPTLPCPYPVNVSAPSTVNEGDTITFASDVAYSGSSALNYTWTVSPPAARIISGAGTPVITVDTTGLGRQSVTAILVVDDGSGEAVCRQTAQAVSNVAPVIIPPVTSREFDKFLSIAYDEDKARFDNFAIQLQQEPESQGYVIVYGGRRSRAGQADRMGERARSYLVQSRGVDPARLTVVNGGYHEGDTYELWIVPRGAQAPQPSPTVSPSEARPGSGRGTPARRRRRR